MGVNYIPAGLYVKEAHRRDVKFNHFILREESGSEAQTVKAGERVRVQLQSASGPDAAYTIIRDALALHFKPLLRMTEEQRLGETVGLVDQGVDSRAAVDIRAWFLKELDVDVPTMKIMGGASISDSVKSAVENMPQSSEGGGVESPVKPVGKEMSSPFPAKPEELLLRPRSERAPTTSTPLPSGSPIFMPAQVTTPTSLSTLAAHLRRGIISTRVPRHRRNQWSSMGWSREFRNEMLGDPVSYHFHLMCENSGFLTTVPCSPDKGYGVGFVRLIIAVHTAFRIHSYRLAE